jgi:IPT/TIG domain
MPLTVTSLAPTHGQPGTEVTINGTGFERGIRVFFYVDSESQRVAFVNERQVRATVPLSASTGTIRVRNPNGEEATSGAQFTVEEPPDVHIVDFAPKFGKTGTKVTIGGEGFASSMVVRFGNTRATTVVWTSAMRITATVPAGVPKGNVSIHVGPATSQSMFRVE